MLDVIRDGILRWYGFLSSLSAQIMPEVQAFDERIRIPLLTALILGVLGAAAPCQLTQSVAMLTILGRQSAGRSRWQAALAYVTGKAVVYTVLGVVAVALGAGLAEVSIPVFGVARKVIGPLMVVVGLAMMGVLRLRWAPGSAFALRLQEVVRRRAARAPFLIGVAFGFSFCPTLFALFFAFLIPLALSRPDGVLYPALFALGTALPLLLVLGLLSLGAESMQRVARQIGRGQRAIAVLAGVLLLIAGLHDTVVYWLL